MMPRPRGRPRIHPIPPPRPFVPDGWVGTATAARIAECGPTLLRDAFHAGDVFAIWSGGKYWFDPATIATAIAARRARRGPGAPPKTPGSPYHGWRNRYGRKRQEDAG